MIQHDELRILHKFLYNRVDLDMFREALEYSIGRVLFMSYVEEKWKVFNCNQIAFVAENNKELLDYFNQKIENTNYKG